MSPLVALCICLAAIAPPQTSSESGAAVEGRPTSAVAAPTTSAERLLGDAFDVASAIPTDPHIKDRSLSQYEIVAAWITLGSPERARACAEGIAPQSWRRGAAFGDIACHYAKCGDVKGAQDCLVAANVVAATQTEWRLERIRERMAEAQRILLAGDVRPTSESIAARRAEIDRLVASADLDQLRVALGRARERCDAIGRTEPLTICFVPFSLQGYLQDPVGGLDALVDEVATLVSMGVDWVALSVPGLVRSEIIDRAAALAAALDLR